MEKEEGVESKEFGREGGEGGDDWLGRIESCGGEWSSWGGSCVVFGVLGVPSSVVEFSEYDLVV